MTHWLIRAQELERRRLSLELHDSAGQLVTCLRLALQHVRDTMPECAAKLEPAQKLADEIGQLIHDLAHRLRPAVLDDIGLNEAITKLLREWSPRAGIAVDFEGGAIKNDRLPPEIETTCYRLAQETLTNIVRHAKATRVSVSVTRHGDVITMAIEDNGVGFDPDVANGQSRLGLLGMRERVQLVGGKFNLESSPGRGTTVIAQFRLPSSISSGDTSGLATSP